jgi:hypothetical protein
MPKEFRVNILNLSGTQITLANILTTGQTGIYYPTSNPSGFITSAEAGGVTSINVTGNALAGLVKMSGYGGTQIFTTGSDTIVISGGAGEGGGSQTPWTGDIDGNNHSLSNLSNLSLAGGGTISGASDVYILRASEPFFGGKIDLQFKELIIDGFTPTLDWSGRQLTGTWFTQGLVTHGAVNTNTLIGSGGCRITGRITGYGGITTSGGYGITFTGFDGVSTPYSVGINVDENYTNFIHVPNLYITELGIIQFGIDGNSVGQWQNSGTGYSLIITDASNAPGVVVYHQSQGNPDEFRGVGIFNTIPQYELDVSGRIRASSGIFVKNSPVVTGLLTGRGSVTVTTSGNYIQISGSAGVGGSGSQTPWTGTIDANFNNLINGANIEAESCNITEGQIYTFSGDVLNFISGIVNDKLVVDRITQTNPANGEYNIRLDSGMLLETADRRLDWHLRRLSGTWDAQGLTVASVPVSVNTHTHTTGQFALATNVATTGATLSGQDVSINNRLTTSGNQLSGQDVWLFNRIYQTPWTGHIDAATYDLNSVGAVNTTFVNVGTSVQTPVIYATVGSNGSNQVHVNSGVLYLDTQGITLSWSGRQLSGSWDAGGLTVNSVPVSLNTHTHTTGQFALTSNLITTGATLSGQDVSLNTRITTSGNQLSGQDVWLNNQITTHTHTTGQFALTSNLITTGATLSGQDDWLHTQLDTHTHVTGQFALTGNAMGTVYHGATSSTARPTNYYLVTWVGSVEPTNAINNDIWIDTA